VSPNFLFPATAVRIARRDTIRSGRRQRDVAARQESDRGRPKQMTSSQLIAGLIRAISAPSIDPSACVVNGLLLCSFRFFYFAILSIDIYARRGPNAVGSRDMDIQDRAGELDAEFASWACTFSPCRLVRSLTALFGSLRNMPECPLPGVLRPSQFTDSMLVRNPQSGVIQLRRPAFSSDPPAQHSGIGRLIAGAVPATVLARGIVLSLRALRGEVRPPLWHRNGARAQR
jgi:hypothetical protein